MSAPTRPTTISMKKPKPDPFISLPVIQPASTPMTIHAMIPCPMLSRGEKVEFPFGSLKKVQHAHKKEARVVPEQDYDHLQEAEYVVLEVDADGGKLLKGTKKKSGRFERLRRAQAFQVLPPRPGRL